jgi:Ulp1 family protease
MPEIHKQTNYIDCGLYAIANAVEYFLTGYTGGLHIKFDQKYMRDHLISCLEKNQNTISKMLHFKEI